MYFSCQDKLLPGANYVEKYINAARLGFDSIEVNVNSQLPLKDRVAEIKKASSESGIIPSTVCGGYRGWLGHFNGDLRNTAIEDIKEIVASMAEIGARGFVVPAAYGMFSKKLPPFNPPRNPAEDKEVLTEGLSIIGGHAAAYGVDIYFEPLNRYEDHMINTVADAVSLIEAVDLPNVNAMLDFFHANIEEDDLAASILKYGEYIKHIHLADSNRLQPGLGHMDFSNGFEALKSINYQGYCALECNICGEGLESLYGTLKFLKQCCTLQKTG